MPEITDLSPDENQKRAVYDTRMWLDKKGYRFASMTHKSGLKSLVFPIISQGVINFSPPGNAGL
jgi:hypothetical protein